MKLLIQQMLKDDFLCIVCVQFLAALNVFLGGDKIISKTETSEFFHNLDDDCWTRHPSPLATVFIGRQFFHIRFQNLMRGQAGLNSLNLPRVLASKLQSHWSGTSQSVLSVFSMNYCIASMVAAVRLGGALSRQSPS